MSTAILCVHKNVRLVGLELLLTTRGRCPDSKRAHNNRRFFLVSLPS